MPGARPRRPGSFRISVDVPLVVLHATVTDRQGCLVSNLAEPDFQVYENGVPQRIQLFQNEDIPVAVGLVVDHSTSMAPKLDEVTAAARAFVRSSNREDQIFVVNFNEIASLGLPGTQSRSPIAAPNWNTRSRTNQPEGRRLCMMPSPRRWSKLKTASRDKKVLIVVSDGGDNASRRSLEQVMKLAGQSNAVIYSVGVFDPDDPDKNPSVLNRTGANDRRRSPSSRQTP